MSYSILKDYRKNIKSIQDKIGKKFIECNNTNNSSLPVEIYFQLNFINEAIKGYKKEHIERVRYSIHSVNYDCRRLAEIFYNTKYSNMLQKIVDQLTEIENYIASTNEYKIYLEEEYNNELCIPF